MNFIYLKSGIKKQMKRRSSQLKTQLKFLGILVKTKKPGSLECPRERFISEELASPASPASPARYTLNTPCAKSLKSLVLGKEMPKNWRRIIMNS